VFAPAAVDVGARAVFALPLRIGASQVGVVTLWRGKPGDLSDEQLADVLTLAGTAGLALLDGHDRSSANGGLEPIGQHPEVHQATYVFSLSPRLGVS
jgi:hypothetical protein